MMPQQIKSHVKLKLNLWDFNHSAAVRALAFSMVNPALIPANKYGSVGTVSCNFWVRDQKQKQKTTVNLLLK